MKSIESAYRDILLGGFLTFWKSYEKEIPEKGGIALVTPKDIQPAGTITQPDPQFPDLIENFLTRLFSAPRIRGLTGWIGIGNRYWEDLLSLFFFFF